MRPTPNYPVILVHLEDPAGSGLAACSGAEIRPVPVSAWPQTERMLCPGCHRQGVAGV